ncbi:MAG TPA: TIGR02117 family protein [Flavobacterium sp.]|jgi:uncharacterized protein (TIGR02117 family)
MKRVFKVVALVVGSFIGFILIYLLFAFCLSRICVNEDVKSKKEVTIYILTNGVHTDIVVPVKNDQVDWTKYIRFENTKARDSTAGLLALGWGDKGFYLETPTWADLKASTAFKAAFGLGNSAIHATFYKKMTENESCKSIQISNAQYLQLSKFIRNSLHIDKDGHSMVIQTDANYGLSDAFYEANGSYSLFQTCNTWTNNALKSCGQKASLWTPFDTGIFYHYK